MSPQYHAILIVGWGSAAVLLTGLLLMMVLSVRGPGPPGDTTRVSAWAMLCLYLTFAMVVLLSLHGLLPWIGSLLPPFTVTGFVTRTYDEPVYAKDNDGDNDYDHKTNDLKYIVVDGEPYMVNNAGDALDADVGDHVRITFTEGDRWVKHLSWIGSDGERLEYRPGGVLDPHPHPHPDLHPHRP